MSTRIALITGASRGIGAAVAFSLAKTGVNVFLGYKTNKILAEEIRAKIVKDGGAAEVMRVEVNDRESIREAVQFIKNRYRKIDILVNNAGIAQEKSFFEITDRDWDEMLSCNLRGPFACAQEVLPGMIENGWGRIVNIASIGGQWGGVNQIHYASSKAALIGLTKSLAKSFSKHDVTINAVSPGLIATDMTINELKSVEGLKKIAASPIGRVGRAEEVAAAVTFLVLPGSEYITGQTINVNGGMYFG